MFKRTQLLYMGIYGIGDDDEQSKSYYLWNEKEPGTGHRPMKN